MNIMADYFEPGALWTFVHSSGKETEYVFDRQMAAAFQSGDPKIPGHSAMHALLNPETGKEAQVSEKWLREGQIGVGSYWLPKASARRVDRAAA